MSKKRRIVVAMSGGVDSSTVAAMLHDQGHEVIGVTLQLYDIGNVQGKSKACCAGKDIYDAKQVAQTLGFSHYVLNYESRFKQSVIDDFADSYIRGETPLPCVRCNQSVKFKDLYQVAKDLDAECLATGHYVQALAGRTKKELHQGADPNKDQSYFLFATTQAQLDFLEFPLGGLTKDQTRAMAKSYGLEIADKPDSQDICFVPNGSYARIIERLRPGACDKGEIVHMDGTVLGTHEGIIHYTIGQRRGLGISSQDPLYVVRIEPATHQVIVGPKEALAATEVALKEVNWIGDEDLSQRGIEVMVKLRSTQAPVAANVYADGVGQMRVALKEPDYAITPGQACVMYQGTRVVGGGWITR